MKYLFAFLLLSNAVFFIWQALTSPDQPPEPNKRLARIELVDERPPIVVAPTAAPLAHEADKTASAKPAAPTTPTDKTSIAAAAPAIPPSKPAAAEPSVPPPVVAAKPAISTKPLVPFSPPATISKPTPPPVTPPAKSVATPTPSVPKVVAVAATPETKPAPAAAAKPSIAAPAKPVTPAPETAPVKAAATPPPVATPSKAPTPPVPAAKPATPAATSKPAEPASDKTAAPPPVAAPAAALAVATPAPVAKSDKPPAQCRRIGPLVSENDAANVRRRLTGVADKTGVEHKIIKTEKGYWVLTPPAATLEDARALKIKLAQQGASATSILMQGEHARAVSLGYFSDQAGAERIWQDAKAKGMNVNLVPQMSSHESYWVNLRVKPNANLGSAWEDLRAHYPAAALIEQEVCP